MKWYHRLGVTVIDKLILVGALFLVTLDNTAGLTDIGWDLVSILLVVIIAYLGVVAFVTIITFFFRSEGRGVSFVKGLVSALLIWLLYPKVLSVLFWLIGSSVSGNVETVLLWTFIIRAGIGVYLGHRWKTVSE